MTLFYILAATLAGGLFSVVAASVVLAVPSSKIDRLLPRLISFSTGSLLGAALLGMIPHASAELSALEMSKAVLVGIISFYVLERALLWRHCHKEECPVHAASGPLLLVGDSFHNFVDGVVIAGAFSQSTALGALTALSTIAHEVPQEVGELMVYLRAGYSRKRAFGLNAVSSLTAVLGGLAGYFFLSRVHEVVPYVLSFAAAGFIYVALADLIPAQRVSGKGKLAVLDLLLLGAGIAVIAVIASGHHHG